MQNFRPFSPAHAAVILGFAALVTSLVMLRRRWRGTPRARALDNVLGAVALLACLVVNIWPLLPANFDVTWSLPLHVCDVATMCVPFALTTQNRPVRALLYFWGLGLSTQGFITPDLQDGPARVGFWMFWLAHFSVVGGAIYDVAARGYRPEWRDYRLSVIADLVYVTAILPLDVIFGLNYGYIGPGKPGQPTLVDALGPWPWRAVLIIGLAIAGTALLMLPWEIASRARVRRARSTSRA